MDRSQHISRRALVAAGAAALAAPCAFAQGAAWPAKPVPIVVPFQVVKTTTVAPAATNPGADS